MEFDWCSENTNKPEKIKCLPVRKCNLLVIKYCKRNFKITERNLFFYLKIIT